MESGVVDEQWLSHEQRPTLSFGERVRGSGEPETPGTVKQLRLCGQTNFDAYDADPLSGRQKKSGWTVIDEVAGSLNRCAHTTVRVCLGRVKRSVLGAHWYKGRVVCTRI